MCRSWMRTQNTWTTTTRCYRSLLTGKITPIRTFSFQQLTHCINKLLSETDHMFTRPTIREHSYLLASRTSGDSRIFLKGEGANSQNGCGNLLFCNFLPKTAWKWKNLDRRGGFLVLPLDPPLWTLLAFVDICLFIIKPCSHFTSLRLRQTSRIGSMETNDGVHT